MVRANPHTLALPRIPSLLMRGFHASCRASVGEMEGIFFTLGRLCSAPHREEEAHQLPLSFVPSLEALPTTSTSPTSPAKAALISRR